MNAPKRSGPVCRRSENLRNSAAANHLNCHPCIACKGCGDGNKKGPGAPFSFWSFRSARLRLLPTLEFLGRRHRLVHRRNHEGRVGRLENVISLACAFISRLLHWIQVDAYSQEVRAEEPHCNGVRETGRLLTPQPPLPFAGVIVRQ
jgi:hypothetical protein